MREKPRGFLASQSSRAGECQVQGESLFQNRTLQEDSQQMFTQVQKYTPKTAFDCPLVARDRELRCQGEPAWGGSVPHFPGASFHS